MKSAASCLTAPMIDSIVSNLNGLVTAQKRRLRETAANCPTCHGTNWVPDTDPAVKCTHQEAAHA